MFGFGKPKKEHKAVATDAERLKAHANMLKRYPQMGDENWGKPKRKSAPVVATVPASKRAKKAESQLRDAGLSDADIKRLKG